MKKDELPFAKLDTPIKEAIIKISEGRLGTVLLVDDEKRLVGLVSDGDIRRALMHPDFSLDAPVSKYATLDPFVIDDQNMLASEALALIEQRKIQLVVITDRDGKVEGVLHIHTLVEKGIS